MIDYLYEKEKAVEKREARMEWFRGKVEEFLSELCSELELDWTMPFNLDQMRGYVLEALKERRQMPAEDCEKHHYNMPDGHCSCPPEFERAMKTEYPIWTLNDIMEIPMERFNRFLYEFNQALTMARTAHAYNKAMGATKPTIQKPFLWIDDEKGEVRTNITWKIREEEKPA